MYLKILTLLWVSIPFLTGSALAQNKQIDDMISELYQSISFDENQAPDYEKFKLLFSEHGKLTRINDTTSLTLVPTDYEQMMNRQRKNGTLLAFKEKELYRKTEIYGNIAHVFSTYHSRMKAPSGSTTERGINSIQLINTKDGWKIISLTWQEENKEYPLPDQYLPNRQ